jgi:lipopolysaccharide transport system permease protein
LDNCATGIANASAASVLRNVVFINNDTANISSETNSTSVNCATDKAAVGAAIDTSPQVSITAADEFINTTITDSSMAFVSGEAILRQLPLPHYIHITRVLWKNFLMLGHNLVILPFVFFLFLNAPTWNLFLFVPGFLVSSLFLSFLGYLLALVTTRFRDMQQIITSLMTVLFYVTPVIWQPTLIPAGIAHLLLGLNPFYHFLQIIRLPILGQAPTFENWGLSIALTLIAGSFAYLASKKYKNRLAYWV